MKKLYISFLILTGLLLTFSANAQIKIGTNGATIAPSSLLELESANQGLLLPRMADTVAINALAPPNGMLIYLTKAPAVGLYVRKVAGWEYLTGSLGGAGNFSSLTVSGTVTAGSFSGPLNGNATSANTAITATNSLNSAVTNDLSTGVPTFPIFATTTPGNTPLRTSTTKLSFIPNTGILTAVGFNGPLVGNVTGIATQAIDAVNASNTDITDDLNSNAIHYPTFVSGTSGMLPQKTGSAHLSYVPLTGALRATTFVGNLTGTATNADNAITTTITNDNTSATVVYPTFVTNSVGNWGQRTANTKLTFVPSTGNLTTSSYTSTVPTGTAPFVVASTTTVANLSATNTMNTNITDDVATAVPVYPTFVTATAGFQNQRTASSRLSFIPSTGALTAASFVGPLNGNATSSTTSIDATNSANSNITNDIVTPTVAYPVFVNGSPGNQPLHVGTSNMSYVPSTGILTARGFVGPLTGNVTGTATASVDAQNTVNMRITDDVISNTPMYPTFVTGTAGPLPPRVASTKLSFTPQTGELTAPLFRGALIGNASTATNVTGVVAAVNGGTGQALYAPSDMLYAGTSTTLDRLAIGAPGTILRVVGGVPTWSTAGGGTVINVSGAPNRISVTDPTVSPIVDISANYVGQTSITTLGTVTTGTWNAGIVPALYGGTGRNGFTVNEILVGGGTGTALASIPLAGTAGRVLTSNGPGSLPSFQTPGIGDMVLAVDQVVTAPKRFTNGNLLIRGTGTGETTLRADANSVGVATFPAGSYTLVGTTGTQTISSKTFSSGTVFLGTTTLDVINNTSQATTGNITAGSFTGPLTGNVTGNASTSTNFTGALAGDVTGNQTSTVVAQVGGQTAANVSSGVIRANTATAVAGNNTIVARDLNGDFSADQITATQGFVGNLTGNASTVTTIPNLSGEVTNAGNSITLNNAAVIGKLVGGTYAPGTGAVAATDNLIQAIGKVEGNANLKAPIANPTFTGTVTIPYPFNINATPVTSTGTQLSYLDIAAGRTGTLNVVYSDSPIFTGSPNLPAGTAAFTQLPASNSTAVATTAFVTAAVGMIKRTNVTANSNPTVGASGEAEIEYTVTGATTSATVVVSPITPLPTAFGIMSSRVSAPGIVSVKYRNFSTAGVPINPVLNITVIQ